jgi:hypothetical protein
MATELRDVSSHEGTIEVCAHKVAVRWWGGPLEDMVDILMEHAEEHIKEMIVQGYTSGQLLWEDEDRGFTGWWEIERGQS